MPGGVVHKLPEDLRKALVANPAALAAWKDITPLGRNEFICWVEDAKQQMTRERRVRRTQEELEEGQRRPCRQIRNGERRPLPAPPPDPMREMMEAARRIGSRWGRDARSKREGR